MNKNRLFSIFSASMLILFALSAFFTGPALAAPAAGAVIWCPTGQKPGSARCTAAEPTVGALLGDLASKSGAGMVYFTSSYSSADATFDHTGLARLTDLTIQGGWNGMMGKGYKLGGLTALSVPLTVQNWVGNVSVNALTISGASGTGLTVHTTGNIHILNVQSKNNTGAGASLDNCNDNGGRCGTHGASVTLTGTNVFDSNAGDGLDVYSGGAISSGPLSANHNGGAGAHIANNYAASATPVTLSGPSGFSGNGIDGLELYAQGAITANNLTAEGNAGNWSMGAYIFNAYNFTAPIKIGGTSQFTGNSAHGLFIYSNGAITMQNINGSQNGGEGLYAVSQAITLGGANTFNNNTAQGAQIFAGGAVNLGGTNSFLNNGSDGLYLESKGTPVSLTRITTDSNYYDGLKISKAGKVTVTCGNFMDNGTSGSGYGWETGEPAASITMIGTQADGNQSGPFNTNGGPDPVMRPTCTLP